MAALFRNEDISIRDAIKSIILDVKGIILDALKEEDFVNDFLEYYEDKIYTTKEDYAEHNQGYIDYTWFIDYVYEEHKDIKKLKEEIECYAVEVLDFYFGSSRSKLSDIIDIDEIFDEYRESEIYKIPEIKTDIDNKFVSNGVKFLKELLK